MDVKELVKNLPIPDTKNPQELELYIIKLRELLIKIIEDYENKLAQKV